MDLGSQSAKFRARSLSGHYCKDTGGGVTTLAMAMLALSLLLGGLAIDFSNIWRHREILQLSADVAAHSGINALAAGKSERAVHDAALEAAQWNTPTSRYGRTIADATRDVHLYHFDEASGRLTKEQPFNAVRVRLARSGDTKNPVPTFLLGLIGVRNWDIAAGSVSALLPTQRCSNAEGVFAHGEIAFQSNTQINSGVCIHSQSAVNLGVQAEFIDGASLTLPDPDKCVPNCRDSAVSQIRKATSSLNLQMPDLAPRIKEVAATFVDPDVSSSEEAWFFGSLEIDRDLSALEEMMVDIEALETGSIVSLSPMEFTKMRAYASGVVYNVRCIPDGYPGDAALTFDDQLGPVRLKDLVLVTDCAIHISRNVTLDGAVILTTASGRTPAITAEAAATDGGGAADCTQNAQSVIMSLGRVDVPAEFLSANVALVTAADFDLVAASNGADVVHRGTSIHTSGALRVAGQHTFYSCDRVNNPLLPQLLVIRQVMTEIVVPEEPVVEPAEIKRDLPGSTPAPLDRTPDLVGNYETQGQGRSPQI